MENDDHADHNSDNQDAHDDDFDEDEKNLLLPDFQNGLLNILALKRLLKKIFLINVLINIAIVITIPWRWRTQAVALCSG